MDIVKQITLWIASVIEAAAALVIALAALEATACSLSLLVRRSARKPNKLNTGTHDMEGEIRHPGA